MGLLVNKKKTKIHENVQWCRGTHNYRHIDCLFSNIEEVVGYEYGRERERERHRLTWSTELVRRIEEPEEDMEFTKKSFGNKQNEDFKL